MQKSVRDGVTCWLILTLPLLPEVGTVAEAK
jgi:hypothetical protein